MKKLVLLLIINCSFISVYSYNTMQVSKLLRLASSSAQLMASGCDFRGAGSLLRSVNFSKAQLSGTLFNANGTENIMPIAGTIKVPGQITDLSGVNFSGATLVSVGFKKAILRGAIFDGADVRYADFSGADLTGARLDKAKNVSLARFCGTIMPDGTKLTGATWKSPAGKVFYSHCPVTTNQ